MALSFAEKRDVQKQIKTCLADLDNKPDFKTKRALQKRLAEAFSKLEGKSAGTQESLVDQFLAGKFIREAPNKFFSIFTKVYGLVQGQLENIKQPILDYLKAHESAMITESAINDPRHVSLNAKEGMVSVETLQHIINTIAHTGKGSITINLG